MILPGELEEEWLDKDANDINQLVTLLRPYLGEWMTAYPVSRLVNSPMHDGRRLIEHLDRAASAVPPLPETSGKGVSTEIIRVVSVDTPTIFGPG